MDPARLVMSGRRFHVHALIVVGFFDFRQMGMDKILRIAVIVVVVRVKQRRRHDE